MVLSQCHSDCKVLLSVHVSSQAKKSFYMFGNKKNVRYEVKKHYRLANVFLFFLCRIPALFLQPLLLWKGNINCSRACCESKSTLLKPLGFSDMPCMERVDTGTNPRYLGQRPGTKSGPGTSNKLLVNFLLCSPIGLMRKLYHASE